MTTFLVGVMVVAAAPTAYLFVLTFNYLDSEPFVIDSAYTTWLKLLTLFGVLVSVIVSVPDYIGYR